MPEPEDASQTTVLSLLNYMKSTFTIGGLEIIKGERSYSTDRKTASSFLVLAAAFLKLSAFSSTADKCSNPVAYETFRNNRALFENNAAFSALKSASSADLYTNDADDPLKMIKVKDETQFLKARADLLEKLLGIFQ